MNAQAYEIFNNDKAKSTQIKFNECLKFELKLRCDHGHESYNE